MTKQISSAGDQQVLNDDRNIDPHHRTLREALRVVGPVLVAAGALLTAVGLISFFSSFGGFAPPRYFWCAFLGLPVLSAGIACCRMGYLGGISRYVAGEIAPVQKDTFNYLADGTQPGVRAIAAAIRDGLAADESSALSCPKCQATNEADARFCSQCGAELPRERSCPACSAVNTADARFCDQCGEALRG